MPKQILRLDPNEDPRLELEWGGYMRDFQVRLDGKLVGHITGGQRALVKGEKIELPDGSLLKIRLKNMGAVEELQVLRDGKPLPGSASDPLNQYSAAVRVAFLWGLFSIVAGGLFFLLDSAILPSLTLHPLSWLIGIAFVVCSVGMARRFPAVGWLAVALLVVDTVLGVNYMRQMDAYVLFVTAASLFLRLFILLRLLPSLKSGSFSGGR